MAERLIAEVRQERILAAVRRDGVVTVRGLVEQLGVAPMTARRDINHLAELGLVRRVHGGATAHSRRRTTSGVRGLTLGMVVPLDHYWTVLSYSAQGEAIGDGARFVLRDAPGGGPQMQSLAATLISESRVDGLILAPPITEPDRSAMHRWLASQEVCTVLVDRAADVTLTMAQSVGADHARGAALAARHLYDLGHRRMGLLRQPGGAAGLAEIEAGWRTTLRHLGAEDGLVFDSVYGSDPRRDDLFATLLFQLRDQSVTGVLVAGHPQAVALTLACHEHQINVPEVLSIVSYGDTDTVLSHPPLTAVRPPRELVGRLAVQLLGNHLRGGLDHRLQHVLVAPTLVVRESTARCPDHPWNGC